MRRRSFKKKYSGKKTLKTRRKKTKRIKKYGSSRGGIRL